MDWIKKEFLSLFFLLFIQGIIFSPLCLGMDNESELIDYSSKGVPRLRHEIRILLGPTQTIFLKEGTSLTDISEIISQERRTQGLTVQIPENQREQFSWQINRARTEQSPMPGKIISNFVEKGQTVEKGSAICVIEAMKMENIIRAPTEGKISHLYYNVGDIINAGKILVSFTKWEPLLPEFVEFLMPHLPWAKRTPSESSHDPDTEPRAIFKDDTKKELSVVNPSEGNTPVENLMKFLFFSGRNIAPLSVSLFSETIVLSENRITSLPHSFFLWAGESLSPSSHNPTPTSFLTFFLKPELREKHAFTSFLSFKNSNSKIKTLCYHHPGISHYPLEKTHDSFIFFFKLVGILVFLFSLRNIGSTYRFMRHSSPPKKTVYLLPMKYYHPSEVNRHSYISNQIAYNINLPEYTLKRA